MKVKHPWPCPTCDAKAGQPCTRMGNPPDRPMKNVHAARRLTIKRAPRLGKGDRVEHQYYTSPVTDEQLNKRCSELEVSTSLFVNKLIELELNKPRLKREDFAGHRRAAN